MEAKKKNSFGGGGGFHNYQNYGIYYKSWGGGVLVR